MRQARRGFVSTLSPLIALLALAGCATPRPDPGIACHLYTQVARPPVAAPPGTAVRVPRSLPAWQRDASPRALSLQAQIAQSVGERAAVKRALPRTRPQLPPPAETYEILVLSAGGQFGAYGSGFLQGWGERADLQPNRADIDMVTGVSTGAMMATYAYLGSSDDPAVRAKYDALLKAQYTTLRNEDVFRPRSPLELLWSNSVFDSTPLRERIAALITDELLRDVVAEAQRSRRLLFVGAVNADSGEFEHFDLIAIARDANHDRRGCYVAAILASAAIPAAFNPVFINSRMYVDGGARQHVFFLAQAALALRDRARNLYGNLHGDLAVAPQTTKNNLIGIVSRTSTIATDQLLLDSAYYVDAEAKRLGYRVHWTAAANTNCGAGASDEMFSPELGSCLWAVGFERARGEANPWQDLAHVLR